MKETGKCGCAPRCKGAKLLILGALIVLNAVYGWFSWGIFVGGIIAIKGLIKLIFGCCPACKCKSK